MDENSLSNREDQFIDYLQSFNHPERNKRLENVLHQRTRFVTVVLENLYQPHNASAVLRSCDCFGIQDVYIIESNQKLTFSKAITKNVHKWLNVIRFPNKGQDSLKECVSVLRAKGYKIAATTPHTNQMDIHHLPVDEPIALMFGSEKNGLSEMAMETADYHVYIPMHGFSESLNISVCAAICMDTVMRKVRDTHPDNVWKLPEKELQQLKMEWVRKSVRGVRQLEHRFREESDNQNQQVQND